MDRTNVWRNATDITEELARRIKQLPTVYMSEAEYLKAKEMLVEGELESFLDQQCKDLVNQFVTRLEDQMRIDQYVESIIANGES